MRFVILARKGISIVVRVRWQKQTRYMCILFVLNVEEHQKRFLKTGAVHNSSSKGNIDRSRCVLAERDIIYMRVYYIRISSAIFSVKTRRIKIAFLWWEVISLVMRFFKLEKILYDQSESRYDFFSQVRKFASVFSRLGGLAKQLRVNIWNVPCLPKIMGVKRILLLPTNYTLAKKRPTDMNESEAPFYLKTRIFQTLAQKVGRWPKQT